MQTNFNSTSPGSSKSESTLGSGSFLKMDGGKSKSNAIDIPSISLPKGGGAIKGVDEKFSVNTVNGTASFSIPLPFSPARGASPSLNLSYNSGSGNGIFGLGWNLALPSIKRKTDKKLPQYFDNIDSDIFLFSEAEDLVPEFKKDGNRKFIIQPDGNYEQFEKDYPNTFPHTHKIRFYKPRIEGLFARIERWTETSTGIITWRVITKDNTATLFGWTENARIADPANLSRIFEWLPEFVFDDKGNCSRYFYLKETADSVNTDLPHNRNRIKNKQPDFTNRYLQKILYGNKKPYKKFGDPFPANDNFLFETVFDFGEPVSEPDIITAPAIRKDAYSDYKSGFEIRTTHLCKRVLQFHHFDEYNGLVKSMNFTYDTGAQEDFTFLKSITSYGYIKKPGGTYSQKNLPATEFIYQPHDWNKNVKTISAENLIHAPTGLDEVQYQFTDLFNEGLAGILSEQAGGWYYKHNLGNGEFENAKLVSPKPSFTGLGSQLQLLDLDGDGAKQLAGFSSEPKGYFELSDENEWQPFKNFQGLLNINLNDPNARMIDLDGDGKPDLLISEDNVFTWYESSGRNGFKNIFRTEKSFDEESGPAILFADSTQSIFLSDMSGDGLSDIVRIRNGEVCYWPNLGYGKFGAKVMMDDSPVFDFIDAFNPSFIKLADIDGSGTTDIIYLGKNKFTCWCNLCGNAFSKTAFEIDAFPDIHNNTKITVTDLLGNGVACIVWSGPLAKDAHSPLRYIDLMNSKKPHVMIGYKNNMGKEVSMEYKASTHFYIEDKKAAKPWITKLHFPVHCIASTETRDRISGYLFKSEYTYHHGYYDHPEKEFRGFGMVEQKDTEDFEQWKKREGTNVLNEDELNQAPVISKTWVHTGAFLGEEKILTQFKKEYWFEEMHRQGFPVTTPEHQIPDAKILDENGEYIDLNKTDTQDWQEALRACKGMVLRSEIFSTNDDQQKKLSPYSVATHNCIIQRLQPRGNNRHAIFIVNESEAVTYSYERDTNDPRVTHKLNIKFDDLGNVLEAATVVYPRRPGRNILLPKDTRDAQEETLISYVENKFTNDKDSRFEAIEPDAYRLRLPAEVKTYQLKGVRKSLDTSQVYSLNDFNDVLIRSEEALYHEISKEPDDTVAPNNYRPIKRLIEHIRTTYRNGNQLDQALPLYQLDSLALPFETYQMAYTPALLNDIYKDKKTDAELADLMLLGKFVHSEGDDNWWIQSGKMNFIDIADPHADRLEKAKMRFYLPISYTDPFEINTKVEYDTAYYLFVKETEDALGNKSGVELFNFRTLSPKRMKDINDNFSEVITDELGLVKAMAVMGKDNDGDGIGEEADDLGLLTEETDTIENTGINNFFATANANGICDSVSLQLKGKDLLKHSTIRFVYDFDVYNRNGKPAVVASIGREQHFKKNSNSPVQLSFEYSNGLGKVIMKKVQAEPGKARQVTVSNDNTINGTEADTADALRWIGNGRTMLNNKGNPVKQYEPFFSVSPKFEDEKELVENGVTPIMYYDAMSRLVKTELPDGSFSKVEFDSWQQKIFDANDTVKDSEWYNTRKTLPTTNHQRIVADKAAMHCNTPTELHFDVLGRSVLQVENNSTNPQRDNQLYQTKIELDIEGNLRTVTDAKANVVMELKYDMLGNKVYQKSMDAGRRWLLMNIAGNPLRTWDERDHEFQYVYDILHRPTQSIVVNTVGKTGDKILNNIYGRVVYGENQPGDKTKNLRGKPILNYDTGGLIEISEYDFKGQPVSVTRTLCKDYKSTVNWTDTDITPASLTNLLEPDRFSFITETDAMGRISKQIAPDKSIITSSYNEAGLLNGKTVSHPDSMLPLTYPAAPDIYIENIRYNEKGQRVFIKYGNGAKTTYSYDDKTFRLINLKTNKNTATLQDLIYTYDPVGNILRIEDQSNDTSFFNNMQVEPVNEYDYDALYRLTKASGRENNGPLNFTTNDNWNDIPKMKWQQPGDLMDVSNYTQNYIYDEVGNITEMNHQNSWKRIYEYEPNNNRLKKTTIANETFLYPHHAEHGYITRLPHLTDMGWNFKEELEFTTKQSVTTGTPEITYYQYDGQGQRIRKITENSALPAAMPTKKEERIYISGYELYKKHSGANAGLERMTLSLMEEANRFVMIERRNNEDDGTEKKLARYQLHNHLGSACLELNENADVISYEEYYPYGATAYQAKNTVIKSAAKRYRYTGKERDEETGLEYHSARYYVPWLGRWLSGDPIGIGDGVNVYRYVKCNPISNDDQTGNQSTSVDKKDIEIKSQFNKTDFDPIVIVGDKYSNVETMSPGKLLGTGNEKALTDEEQQKWFDQKIFQYREYIERSAEKHKLPPQLLAAIILNELADYNSIDSVEDAIPNNLGLNISTGIAQITPDTVSRYALIDGLNYTTLKERNRKIKDALQSPEIAIEAAARRVKQILHEALDNPKSSWAKQFIDESKLEKIGWVEKKSNISSISNLYSLIRIDDLSSPGGNFDQMREQRLAQMVSAAYNSDRLLKGRDSGERSEVSVEEGSAWWQARRHGRNAFTVAGVIYSNKYYR